MAHSRAQSAEFHRPSALVAALALAAAAALVLGSPRAAAALYKWTDANGRVIYSDQPPSGNFKVETIDGPPPPSNPNAVKELANKEAELKQQKILRADEDAKAAKAKAEADKKREQCAKVQGQLAALAPDQNQQVLIFRTNEMGEPVYMDDAGRRKERDQLEGWLRENCSS